MFNKKGIDKRTLKKERISEKSRASILNKIFFWKIAAAAEKTADIIANKNQFINNLFGINVKILQQL